MNEVMTPLTALDTVIKESGLEPFKAKLLQEQFQNAYDTAAEWEKKAKTIKVTDVTQANEMRMAREGRLLLKEKRVFIEKRRVELKEQSLREGKAIDGVAKFLKSLIEPIENYLGDQEKFIEVQEEKRKEALKAERLKLVSGLIEDTSMYDFANMPEAQFTQLVEGTKLMRQKAEDDARKATEERAAKEKADAEEREKMRAENERLRKAHEELEAKAKKDKAAQDEKLRKERAEREKIEAELAAKQKAENDAQAAKERAEAQAAKEKAAADRKAKAAPDRVKVRAYFDALSAITPPTLSNAGMTQLLNEFVRRITSDIMNTNQVMNELD